MRGGDNKDDEVARGERGEIRERWARPVRPIALVPLGHAFAYLILSSFLMSLSPYAVVESAPPPQRLYNASAKISRQV